MLKWYMQFVSMRFIEEEECFISEVLLSNYEDQECQTAHLAKLQLCSKVSMFISPIMMMFLYLLLALSTV